MATAAPAVAAEREVWPSCEPSPAWAAVVETALDGYHRRFQYSEVPDADYSPTGPYFDYAVKSFQTERILRDADSVPMLWYRTGFYYNPVTVAQYALSVHARLAGIPPRHTQQTAETLGKLMCAGERLLRLQGPDGAFRYTIQYEYHVDDEIFAPGWVSGMAQGVALSAFARLYAVTGDERYLEAGNRSLDFLRKPVKEGGTATTLADLHPTLRDYVIFEEYVTSPNTYTLNGFLFTVLGLYDWSRTTRSAPHAVLAEDLFAQSMKTVRMILPYYELNGITSYDLSHITRCRPLPYIAFSYHRVHIQLLLTLGRITKDPYLRAYAGVWQSHVSVK